MSGRSDKSLSEEQRWARVTDLFDRLLIGGVPDEILAGEPDEGIRRTALDLWRHHHQASLEGFIPEPMRFEPVPVFVAGQLVLERFRINKLLGAGGMGEVYLAFDTHLQTLVALKTIARLLAPSPAIRRRFVAEVRHALSVAHENVCRIHTLFEEGSTPFFSMEYVEGTSLEELRGKGGRITRDQGREIVRQIARGLGALHAGGVTHGDLKPANILVASGRLAGMRVVIMDFGLARALDDAAAEAGAGFSVRGAASEYSAPELPAASPTVRSDIYAFGRIAGQLWPGERLWEECTATDPARRPASIEAVLKKLESTRRYWLGGIAVTGLALAGTWKAKSVPGFVASPIPEGARVFVNGFADAGTSAEARFALTRSLIVASLRQSPRLRTIADEDLLSALRKLKPRGQLPLGGEQLLTLLRQLRAGFWVDGKVRQAGSRYSLALSVQRMEDRQVVAQASFQDVASVLALAQQAAIWLREAAGESSQSVAANSGAFTSSVPEALSKYFEAMEHYAVADMASAIPLLEEAVRLEPAFAQAYSMLAMCRNGEGEFDGAFAAVEKAIALSGKLPERERTWVEYNYATLVDDPDRMQSAGQRNLVYFPDEPRFNRQMGRTMVRVGRAPEGVPFSRKALELSPDDPLLRTDLVVNLCEAGQFEEALRVYEARAELVEQQPYMRRGQGLALLGLGRYGEAGAAFAANPRLSPAWTHSARLLDGNVDGAVVAMREEHTRARDRKNLDDQLTANEFLCGVHVLLDRPDLAGRYLREMAEVPEIPAMSRALDTTAFWAARLGDDGVLEQVRERMARVEKRWPHAHTRSRLAHVLGLQAWRQGAREKAEEYLLASAAAPSALLTQIDLADFYAGGARAELAEDFWRRAESGTGVILARMFVGLLIVMAANRGAAALARGDKAAARKYSGRVLGMWGKSGRNEGLGVVQMARRVMAAGNG